MFPDVLCKLAYSFTLDFPGAYAPGDTYNTSCYVEASGNHSLSDLDVNLSFGNITYCHNSQVVPVGRNHSCAKATVQNRTTYYFTLPDLSIADSGTYSCKITHKTEGHKLTISQNIIVINPSTSMTTQSLQVTTQDGTGGSTPIHTQAFSTLLLVLVVVKCYADK
ncbi:uncharacterized protein LOC133188383 [Saccostrea echinata]|uniref:uncharacterized protein LOC133188383 n=1 Tax=Saccostrea echinata TaxID=191078 RepID=UPI002A8377E1|nr:uncharacterized protein LOC133188383 [Saccostrea echinata]